MRGAARVNARSGAPFEAILRAPIVPILTGVRTANMELEGDAKRRLRPAAPIPHSRNLSTLQVLRELSRNPVAAFGARSYREPYVYARSRIQDFLMISDPEGIRRVLLDNAGNYSKSVQFQRLTRPALGNGLANAEASSWRFQRRLVAPMFSMRQIAEFAPAMAAAAEAEAERWMGLGEGAEIDAAEAMMRLTYAIISQTLFSNDVKMQYGRMAEALSLYLETQGRVGVLRTLGLPNWAPTPGNLRARAPLSYFRREIGEVIARRRQSLARDAEGAANDLLAMLLAARDPEGGRLFGEQEVFDNVMTFVFAGHETTANALAWTLYLLSQFPETDARVADEIAAASRLEELVYTRMTVEESMRLYPPAPIVTRDSIGPDEVGGIAIRPGTFVMISPWVLHRHRRLWEEPDYFDPERFAPGRRDAIHRFAYIPFGAGPRICIGMGFAMQEALIILSAILKRFRLELVAGHPVEPQARLTLRPKHGLKMRIWRR